MSASKEKNGFEFNLPSFGGGRRRDVLFFTQELSTLLNSGVPLDRALSITSELTTRPQFRAIVLDILRSIKGGKSLADALALHPALLLRPLHQYGARRRSFGQSGQIFERLSEFERSRDELRSYIVSSMIYPALLALVGAGSIFVLLDFVVPRFASVFDDSRMKIPLPTLIMLQASNIVQDWWWLVALALVALAGDLPDLYTARRTDGSGGTTRG